MGAYFSHGPQAGGFDFERDASLPKSPAKKQRKSVQEIATAQGLTPAEVGPIDRERFLCFVWGLGRPSPGLCARLEAGAGALSRAGQLLGASQPTGSGSDPGVGGSQCVFLFSALLQSRVV